MRNGVGAQSLVPCTVALGAVQLPGHLSAAQSLEGRLGSLVGITHRQSVVGVLCRAVVRVTANGVAAVGLYAAFGRNLVDGETVPQCDLARSPADDSATLAGSLTQHDSMHVAVRYAGAVIVVHSHQTAIGGIARHRGVHHGIH